MIKIIQGLFSLLLVLALSLPSAYAQDKLDTSQRKRAQQLYYQVKCPVCSGQSVAESDNQIAMMIRDDIDQLLSQGYSDEAILLELANGYNLEATNRDSLGLYIIALILLMGFGIYTLKLIKSSGKLP